MAEPMEVFEICWSTSGLVLFDGANKLLSSTNVELLSHSMR